MRILIPTALILATAAWADPAPKIITLQPDQKYYPADAAAQKVAGAVLIKLTIEPTGNLSCAILDKAAPAILKRPSCEVAVQHWNLAPEMKDGAMVKTEVQLSVQWKLPGTPEAGDFGGAVAMSPEYWIVPADYPAAARKLGREANVGVKFDITPIGHAVHCVADQGTPTNEFSAAACRAIEQRALFLPAFNAKGEPLSVIGHKKVHFGLDR